MGYKVTLNVTSIDEMFNPEPGVTLSLYEDGNPLVIANGVTDEFGVFYVAIDRTTDPANSPGLFKLVASRVGYLTTTVVPIVSTPGGKLVNGVLFFDHWSMPFMMVDHMTLEV